MQNTVNSYISDNVYIIGKDDAIINAVYPMKTLLGKGKAKRITLGGSLEPSLGESRFDDLAIPSGLYVEPRHLSYNYVEPVLKKTTISVTLDDDIFDKLLNSVSKVKIAPKTRRKNKEVLKKTKKKITFL
jgi:hypothetical protein